MAQEIAGRVAQAIAKQDRQNRAEARKKPPGMGAYPGGKLRPHGGAGEWAGISPALRNFRGFSLRPRCSLVCEKNSPMRQEMQQTAAPGPPDGSCAARWGKDPGIAGRAHRAAQRATSGRTTPSGQGDSRRTQEYGPVYHPTRAARQVAMAPARRIAWTGHGSSRKRKRPHGGP